MVLKYGVFLSFVLFTGHVIFGTCDHIILEFSTTDLSLALTETEILNTTMWTALSTPVEFTFTYRDTVGHYLPDTELDQSPIVPLSSLLIGPNESVSSALLPRHPGYVVLGLNATNPIIPIPEIENLICRVTVMHFRWLDILQQFVGWCYFAAWTISFYPQIILNWRRKSVVGFNMDFLAFNIVGFIAYSAFNIALFWSKSIQKQYHELYPVGVIPVLSNDVAFSLHAVATQIILVIQCVIYERGGQRVSKVCIGILCLMGAFVILSLILAGTHVFTWLTCLYNLSYLKLVITLIKYIPQAVMNFRRRSTVGWSIGNIMLDFTGGTLSILQMFILAYNYDDWSSVFGSPTKVGLGLFSIAFDILFMIQHWGLYRRRNTAPLILQINDDEIHSEVVSS